MLMALLELEGISKSYAAEHVLISGSGCDGAVPGDRRIVLRDVGLALAQGGAVGIVGESGAGKSTLAQIVAGLIHPDSGVISVDGVKTVPSRDLRSWSQRVQMVWQDAAGSLDPRMKLGRSIAEPLRIHRNPGEEESRKVRRLMEEVELGEELLGRYPHELSGGQVQRAVIARALAMNPEVLVLDEPASALDARVKRRVIELLKRLRSERGKAQLIITHDIGLASELAAELVILKAGEIVEEGATASILEHPQHPFTLELIDSIPRLPGQRPM